jgi:predicted PurR-regulated permease PerM
MLISQITLLSEKIVSQKDAIYSFIHNSFERVKGYDEGYISNNLKEALSSFTSEFANVARSILYGVLNSGKTAFNAISLVIITPIALFYFLRDWNKIAKTISKIFPNNLSKISNKLIAEINETLAGYIRGQSLVCFILATYYSMAFYIMGLESSFALGVTSGILVFVPYVGAIFSCILTLLAAIIQFEEFVKPGIILIIFLVGQFVEGNFLVPKIVGERVNLHPVWIMLGLVAGSSLMGFIGLLIALPLTAALGVIIRFAFAKYKNSSFYNN